MRRRTLLKGKKEGIDSSESVAGDICLYSKDADQLIIIPGDSDLAAYPADKYTPVGVVVVPGTHNVYGDGTCGVMSLKYMDYSNPDNGSTSEVSMYWGGYNVDTDLKNYNVIANVGSYGSVSSTIQGTDFEAYLPSDDDSFTKVLNPYDTNTKYYHNDSNNYAPSPYKNDGSRNPIYYQISQPSSPSNCLSDFDGFGNTAELTKLVTRQSNWKTDSVIVNNDGSGYYPAACCCWRYHTEGTKQGDWYLPSAGEFGYVIVRFKAINRTILVLSSTYGSDNILPITKNYFWSSTEYGDTITRIFLTTTGESSYSFKYASRYVRGFLRV